ncbi:MAG TPA: sensor domain-containing diguanylate cyclase, partial [Candidatus Limnocylindrales bacterium]
HSLDPRQVAATIARHVAGAMAVDRCIVSSFDRAGDSIVSLGTFPPTLLEHVEPAYPLGAFPETRRVLAEQGTVVVDVDDPGADGAEVALLRAEGNATLAMLPLVANGASIGLIELLSVAHVTFDAARLELARTMVNEAAIALENAHLYEAARDLADHDQLTGFYNHRYLHERLGEEIVRAQRNRSPLGLLMIDLDDFKLVNDTFGHLFGDSVLSFVAELIRSTLRASDVPARYGGDEFAVILPETDHDAAERAAARIAEACRRHPFESDTRGSLPIGLSIGVGTFPADGRTGQDVIAAADQALYRAKGDGYAAAGPTPERFRVVRDEVGLPGR